jgi:hypothetical protein
MSRVGRPRNTIPNAPARIVRLPITLDAEIELLLTDPTKQKIEYGAFNGLVTQLLSEWVEEKRK